MIINRENPKLVQILKRGEVFDNEYMQTVLDIISNVKENGDNALFEYTSRFDKFELSADSVQVAEKDIENALNVIPQELKDTLYTAKERIASFHERQLEESWFYDDGGVLLGQKVTPMDRVGVYVPGGKAAYPSSVLMNILPAKVAGVKEVIMVTPTPGGAYNPVVLAAAKIAGADKIYRIGGAQAIAALAYGTAAIPKVDKIVGPGNIYVALAKKMVFGAVDIDMIAGPSEILVIADDSANPAWVAADMLSQSEHDELASSVAITLSEKMAKAIEKELYIQLEQLSRKDIARKSMEKYSAIIVAENIEDACDIANSIASEHLELCVEAPMEVLKYIRHAGAIFMGHYTPEAAGDYFAGPNHVLPTGGSARFFSPLGVHDFTKRSSLIYYDKTSLNKHGRKISLLAESEGLEGHSRSVKIRMDISE